MRIAIIIALLAAPALACDLCRQRVKFLSAPPVLYQYKTSGVAQQRAPEAEDARIARIVAEVLRQTGVIPQQQVLSPVQRHCGKCHGSGQAQEQAFSLDSLDTAEQRLKAIRALWHPPEAMKGVVGALKPEEMSELIDWLSNQQETVPAPPAR